MEENIKTDKSTDAKRRNYKKLTFYTVLLVYLLAIGVFTAINYLDNKKAAQDILLYKKGIQISNSYDNLPVTRIQDTSYSKFPHRLLEIHADENTLYSYRDDFYKDYSQPGVEIDKNKIVIYLTERQVFDDPIALAMQPECEAMAKIESDKRQPEYYENMPTEIELKYIDQREPTGRKVYVYTPKFGHCTNVFSDERLLRVRSNANSIRYSF